ncbi:secreted protein (plasmid) [Streptantibioticus cattleyicolor NRRL 8057 = DSM 46488]|uniref:Secreted protein n=1 Tax=Streptantibioticus cattleyicolor (strain ATCC 35852 / DSM 46488 / JCM 4925 / NBRC 14057 / NRRL 8057) TaxID=1003195 RepID=G8XF30_STREN|nr:secreted protein [Streptantibioticus cattleyicolor NRRL 8057 = DSM 46488]
MLATTVAAAALATAAGTATAAGSPAGAERARAEAGAREHAHASKAAFAAPLTGATGQVNTPTFSMTAVDRRTGELYLYFPDGTGAFKPRQDIGVTYDFAVTDMDVDNDKDGRDDGTWQVRKDGSLYYTWSKDLQAHTKRIGGGWNIYTKVLSPGNLGGAPEADLLAVDKSGVLWEYLGYPDGRVTKRIRVGEGWNRYTEIAGQGDLTGDGKADVVARDTAGVLWLYQGTGDAKAPFQPRTRVGGGWNAYNRLLSVGDHDGDGKSDLIARNAKGELFRYSGTGDAHAPYRRPVKIGWGFTIYNLL